MNGSFTVKPESYRTSNISPIILSEGKRVQVSFEAKQVDNNNNLQKNIKGNLVIKRKTKAIQSFSDVEKFSKKDIQSNEYIEIALDTNETYKLVEGLLALYRSLGGKQTDP